jgi:hypothetical protein
MLFRIHNKTVDLFSPQSSVTVTSVSLTLLALPDWSDYLTRERFTGT